MSMQDDKKFQDAVIKAHTDLENGEGLSFANIFKAGAEWKEEQMIKDSVDGTVSKIGGSAWIDTDDIALERVLNNYEKDAKVKIIIIKEEEK